MTAGVAVVAHLPFLAPLTAGILPWLGRLFEGHSWGK